MNALLWVRAQWDRVLATVLFVVGGLALVVGWAGVRSEALTALQVPYVISGGIGGIFLLGLGAVFWLSADLRDEWRKLDQVVAALGGDQDSVDALGVVAVDPWEDLPADLLTDLPTTSAKPARRRAGGRREAPAAPVIEGAR
jgi:hypothetical protein